MQGHEAHNDYTVPSPILNLQNLHENQTLPKQKSVGYWEQQQHRKYIIFIDFFRKQVSSKKNRMHNSKYSRAGIMYRTMAGFIQSRDQIQCRSHHTKLLRSFKNVRSIIQEHKNKIGESEYEAAKKIITSNHKVFEKNWLQQKQHRPIKISNDNIKKMNSIGVQTDALIGSQNSISFNISEEAALANVMMLSPLMWFVPL